ncbi:MAG TPA: stage II sporulation protein D [Syntrophomonadaceae bacterium]|nr:stage II sporulation protein D [Syntrophomonadaceae bacterium]
MVEPTIHLYRHESNTVSQMKFEDYVLGCMIAEMPLSFELEALKAQAICARTYAFRKLLDKKNYPCGADLSDNIMECQAFMVWEDYYDKHPHVSKDLIKRAQKAVQDTRGIIILYQQEPIDAVYHSCCGGKTESAFNSWGRDTAYLQSVSCSYCQSSCYYTSSYSFPNTRITGLVGKSEPWLQLSIIKKTASGRTVELEINGQRISGNEFRHKLGLPSNYFELKVGATKTNIYCRGYGHGVGLCQFGANGMAKSGKDAQAILRHYYGKIDFYKLPY